GSVMSLRNQPCQVASRQLGLRHDDGEWRPKFMSRNSQEFIFEGIGLAHGCLARASLDGFLLPMCLVNGHACQLRYTVKHCNIPDAKFMPFLLILRSVSSMKLRAV